MPGEPFFLDSGGWIALLNTSERLHVRAREVWRDLIVRGRPVVLTDLIIAETGNALARSHSRGRFVAAVQLIRESSTTRLTHTDPGRLEGALALYGARTDKAWGLVDCVSFRLMEQQGVTDAFTTDHHFEQAGFKCLLQTGGR